jgi:hypothetical protein
MNTTKEVITALYKVYSMKIIGINTIPPHTIHPVIHITLSIIALTPLNFILPHQLIYQLSISHHQKCLYYQ